MNKTGKYFSRGIVRNNGWGGGGIKNCFGMAGGGVKFDLMPLGKQNFQTGNFGLTGAKNLSLQGTWGNGKMPVPFKILKGTIRFENFVVSH